MSEKDISSIISSKLSNQARYKQIIIKKNISRKEVALIETENSKLPGVSVDTFISREYLDESVGHYLLGYISEIKKEQLEKYRRRDRYYYKQGDFTGQFGLEEMMDLKLRGRDGYEFVEVDALGRKKRHIGSEAFITNIKNAPVTPGHNMRLTIDRDMQKAAYEALKGKVGSVVAIDIHTGEILSMVSRPSFEPSQFSRGISSDYWSSLINDENNPLRARTIQEHYPPGSTFKAIAALAGLEEGLIDMDTSVNCTGRFRLGRRRYHCWKKYGHRKTGVYKSLRESCNVFYYKLATKLDIDTLAKYAMQLGLGKKSGISLTREASGLIPTKEWKVKRDGIEWQLGETLSCIIGQSYVLATPLQLAIAYSGIANGGKVFKPYLVKEVFTNSGEVIKKFSPELNWETKFSKESLDIVREGLFQVVNNRKGTAWWRRGRGIHMAGKTGTSQVLRLTAENVYDKCEDLPFKERRHGVFAAFAPYDDPKIAIASVVEHGCHGSSAAAPVAEKVVSAYMNKYQPQKVEEIKEIEKKQYLKLLREQKKKKQEEEETTASL